MKLSLVVIASAFMARGNPYSLLFYALSGKQIAAVGVCLPRDDTTFTCFLPSHKIP